MNPLELPPLTKHVTDLSGVLGNQQAELLSTKFAEHENTTTEQVLTVLIPHRQGHELRDIGLKLFNENGIGQQDLNNGLLLIVSTEEKKLRIITGKGMEIKYSEMICREIVEKQLRPLLNEGRYEEMIARWGEIVRDPEYRAVLQRKANLATILGVGIITSFICFISKDIDWNTLGNMTFGADASFGYSGFYVVLGAISFFLLLASERRLFRYIWGIFFIICLSLGILPFMSPPDCQRVADREIRFITTTCSRTILGKVFSSSHDEYTELYRSTHPEQFRSSSNSSDSDWGSSSSSSFGGGGGSSNGGGYGD